MAYFRATDEAAEPAPILELADARATRAAGAPPGESPEEALTRRIMARRMTPEAMLGTAKAWARAMEAAGR